VSPHSIKLITNEFDPQEDDVWHVDCAI